jgi:glycosyltransferase involved in cell wall biosynthesis
VRRDRIVVLYNPLVDEATKTRAGQPVDHPWFNGEHPVVVSAGRLYPQKGFPVMLEAFAAVHRRLPQARLVILGEGPERAALEAKTEQLGLKDVVSFPGFKKNPQAYFARAQVFAMSSFNEGLCNVIVEAMATGTPAVSTDCPHGPSEIISHGSDGYLVPVGDHHKLAQHLIELLESPADARRMGEAARLSSERFGVTNVMKNYERAIEMAAGERL